MKLGAFWVPETCAGCTRIIAITICEPRQEMRPMTSIRRDLINREYLNFSVKDSCGGEVT